MQAGFSLEMSLTDTAVDVGLSRTVTSAPFWQAAGVAISSKPNVANTVCLFNLVRIDSRTP